MTKTSYFSREVKVRTHEQMLEVLKGRTAAVPAILVWNPPVKATQTTADGRYEIRRTEVEGRRLYWAWGPAAPVRKLLGHGSDVDLVRAHCEAHARTR